MDPVAPIPSGERSPAAAAKVVPQHRFGLPGALLRAVRPRQWVKNVLVFVAPIAAGTLFHRGIFGPTLVAFVAFCLVSSGTYLFNDIRDVDVDRHHPKKRFRPIASGELPVPIAATCGVILLLGGVALGTFAASWQLGVTLGVYVLVTAAYTAWLKREPVIELACVAAGFVLRALGGGAASHTPLSVWFIVVISFGALFIVIGKRLAELPAHAGDDSERRAVLKHYSKTFLESALTLTATVSVTAYCLWAFEGSGIIHRALGREVWIHLTLLPVVLGTLHVLRLLDAGEGGAPEELVYRDRTLQVLGVLWAAFLAIGIYG